MEFWPNPIQVKAIAKEIGKSYKKQEVEIKQPRVHEIGSYPRRGGIAPTTAPTQVFTGCICFRGVYTNAYRNRLEAASPAAIILACKNLAVGVSTLVPLCVNFKINMLNNKKVTPEFVKEEE